MPLSNKSVLARMPKTELHLYLEGTVRPEALWDLSHREGVPLPGETPEGTASWRKIVVGAATGASSFGSMNRIPSQL